VTQRADVRVPFELKGASYPLPSLRLTSTDVEAIRAGLKSKVREAPALFADAPVVIDFGGLNGATPPVNLLELIALVRGTGMVPIGVCNAGEKINRAAVAAGLGVFRHRGGNAGVGTAAVKAEAAPQPAPAAAAPEPPPAPEELESQAVPPPVEARAIPGAAARIVRQVVRSGQKIYARGGDLIVLGAVNAGAEVIADGHIHIYGPLRGRAIAGARGDESACIFCHGLQAELIAIAGIFRLLEEPDAALRERAVQVCLSGDRLKVIPL
jgi:septum site-determining protein MinC